MALPRSIMPTMQKMAEYDPFTGKLINERRPYNEGEIAQIKSGNAPIPGRPSWMNGPGMPVAPTMRQLWGAQGLYGGAVQAQTMRDMPLFNQTSGGYGGGGGGRESSRAPQQRFSAKPGAPSPTASGTGSGLTSYYNMQQGNANFEGLPMGGAHNSQGTRDAMVDATWAQQPAYGTGTEADQLNEEMLRRKNILNGVNNAVLSTLRGF